MKNRIVISFLLLVAMLMQQSCVFFEVDNLDLPAETLKGKIVDTAGNPIQVEYGDGARIVLLDFGYHTNPQELYLKVQGDGTFINTKVFESTYDIIAEGPFVPLKRVSEGIDLTQKNIHIKGVNEITFTVEPLLKLDWIGEPIVNGADGTFTANFTMVRGTENTDYHNEIQDVRLFISTTQFVGNGDYDNLISPVVSEEEATTMLNNNNTLTTKINEANLLEKGRPYYIRVGARLNNTGSWGSNNYCYTTVKKVVLPL